MNNVTNRKKKLNNYKQNGGELLGSGGFGCVLDPYISCSKKNKSLNIIKKFKKKKNLVSKLVILKVDNEEDLESIYNEISISKTIKKIDKNQKYLSPIIKHCNYILNKKNSKRDDIKHVNTYKEINTLKHISRNNYKKTKKCIINLNKNYIAINLVLKNSGIDLYKFISKSDSTNKNLFKNNIKFVCRDLLSGIELLHKKYITHKDLKLQNICVNIKNNYPVVTIIDFGLSEDLSKLKHDFTNFIYSGTPCYMSIDFTILLHLKSSKFERHSYRTNKLRKNIENKKIYKTLLYNYESMKQYNLKSILLENEDTYKNYNKLKSNVLFDLKDIDDISNYFINLYDETTLIKEYFKKINGINCKLDIFSLGRVLLELTYYFEINNKSFNNLISKMLKLKYTDRHNILQCLDHEFLVNK